MSHEAEKIREEGGELKRELIEAEADERKAKDKILEIKRQQGANHMAEVKILEEERAEEMKKRKAA
jgi:hypothetical protein